MGSTGRALRRLVHPAYKALESAAHELRYLFVEITQRCNLDCLHCGSDCGRDAHLAELTPAEWVAFLDALPRQFDRKRLVLILTGGEPFCCPSLDAILAALKRNQLAWGMVTNGWALTDDNLARAMAHGLATMTVSLDGLAASHDWLRGRTGSFERAVAGIRRAAAVGLPFFDVVTCVNPRNLGELPQIHSLLRSLGAKAWRLFSIFPKGRARGRDELRLSDDGLRELFAWIAKTRRDPTGADLSVQFSCEGYLPPRLDQQVRDEPYFCRAGVNIASVLCDGAIAACPNITRTLVQGNVRTDDLLTVWEERFAPFRDRRWMRTGACEQCGQWKRCQGNSLHLWDDETKRTALCHHGVLGG